MPPELIKIKTSAVVNVETEPEKLLKTRNVFKIAKVFSDRVYITIMFPT